jgi:phage terminase small subunit
MLAAGDISDEGMSCKLPAPIATEPTPELGPAMRSLNPRWQRAVQALFTTGGNRTAALRLAGYKCKRKSMHVLASRMFGDARMRAAIREEMTRLIDTVEPEVFSIVIGIARSKREKAMDRLRASEMLWARSNPVVNRHRIEVEHHLSNDERDVQHYRALKKIGAAQEAFVARFGPHGIARVEALILAEENKRREIESGAAIDADYEDVTDDQAEAQA